MRTLLGNVVVAAILCFPSLAQTTREYDLVVYGGTAGGVITSVAAAREGLSVVLLEPGRHIGGMVSGGLSRTDIGKSEVIGGYSLEFYWRAARHYDVVRYAQDVAWFVEPKIAEQIFHEMLDEALVPVLFGRRLREKTGVRKDGSRLIEITTENAEKYRARIFVDATYEGDLMAQSGVSYTWGREAASQYGESLAGVREKTPFHQFLVKVSARAANGRLLPEISADPPGAAGAADKKVQAYNFRLCLTKDAANRVPYPKPSGYDPRRYELFARLLKEQSEKNQRPTRLGEVISPFNIPNRKADINNNGAFSTDYIGGSWEYPEASYSRRAEIWRAHIDYTKGFFYFLANDPQVPESLRNEANQWGLAKDEFVDNGNWPHQLYIREARRMVGEFVMTQKDLQTDLRKQDVIGMGSYNSDSHNVYRFADREGFAENEGDMQVPVTPYQIPYRVLLPKRSDATNLLVPVCFSASHVAYSSLRMEPQYMILGHAAGIAAAMAIHTNKPVQDIDTAALSGRLKQQGAIFDYVPSPQQPAYRIFRQMHKLPAGQPY